jgi:receptor protein-tyrosine kinase
LVCIDTPDTIAAEAFRILSVRLRYMAQSRQMRRILITSAVPEEGKSVCATNLATCLARIKHQKTLLIEGDLRRRAVSNILGLSDTAPGMTDLLRGKSRLTAAICRVNPPGFYFLPAGRQVHHPVELMQSGSFSKLIEEVSSGFDWVIIDSTPLVPLADTGIWTPLCDGILLVVREGKSEKELINRAMEVVGRSKLLGVVLNGFSGTKDNQYYGYYSSSSSRGSKNSTKQ